MTARPLRIAVAVHTFPVLSETFVLEPVVYLIERGHQVQIIALYRGEGAAAHPAVHEYALYGRAVFLIDDRPGRGRFRKGWTGLKRLLKSRSGRLPLGRMLQDVANRSVLKLSPELLLAAVGAADIGSPDPLSYDVVHAHMGRTGLVMQHLRAWNLLHGPLLTTFHGSDVLVEPGRHPPGLYDRLFTGAAALTANTNFLVGALQALGAPREKCTVVPVGVNPTDFEFRPRRLASGQRLRILTVARLDPLKGIRYGIEAVDALRKEGVDVTYTIIGEGPERPELEDLIRRRGLEDIVQLVGSLKWDRIPGEYARHHVFLLPGIISPTGGRESQGKVLIEAQASGMPVVATAVGGIPEAVAPGAGRLVPQKDSVALARAIMTLLDDRDRWEEMGRRGRAYVEARFDTGRLTEETVERYREISRAFLEEQQ